MWITCFLIPGTGYCMVAITAIYSLYHNVLVAYALFYMAYSLFPELPWSTCDNEWNTQGCVTHAGQEETETGSNGNEPGYSYDCKYG